MKEYYMQLAIVQYMQIQYPQARLHSDLSGVPLGKKVAGMSKAINPVRGFPDLVIYHPAGPYTGLALELKAEGQSPYRKDGKLKASEHLAEQASWLETMRSCGFLASFATGFDEAKGIIDRYFTENQTTV